MNRPITKQELSQLPAGFMATPKGPNRRQRRRILSKRRSSNWYGLHVKHWQRADIIIDGEKVGTKLIGHVK